MFCCYSVVRGASVIQVVGPLFQANPNGKTTQTLNEPPNYYHFLAETWLQNRIIRKWIIQSPQSSWGGPFTFYGVTPCYWALLNRKSQCLGLHKLDDGLMIRCGFPFALGLVCATPSSEAGPNPNFSHPFRSSGVKHFKTYIDDNLVEEYYSSHNGRLPQIKMKEKHIWNHHLVDNCDCGEGKKNLFFFFSGSGSVQTWQKPWDSLGIHPRAW